MTDTEAHFRLLARQYLDLWQEQMAALAKDPQTADLWAKGMDWSRYMQANPLFAQSMMQNPLQAGAYANPAFFHAPAPAGATPAAPASGESSDDVRRCREHIKELEQRVLALEAALAAKSRRPASRTKKTKPE